MKAKRIRKISKDRKLNNYAGQQRELISLGELPRLSPRAARLCKHQTTTCHESSYCCA